jgi:hypothetical protein
MKPAALAPLGVVAVLGLAWYGWRRHVRAGLPGSVQPEEGGRDEAPPGSVDASETPGKDGGA